ncbi:MULTISPECIES: rod-binding protein [unclassified Beijerinckia]|uniref:rod-binding protein n=1 Tax=unclassified Beijerinckia TaxID=2638183 RepID=UPI001FCD1AF4|nr:MULTISPECIES: rod-binding protein [unclassified Beijerinckia]
MAEGASQAGSADFAADLARLQGPGFGDIRARLAGLTQSSGAAAASAQKTAKEFEAVLLQKSIEAMLPNSEKIYGKGNAGSIWKSMLSKELATQLVNRGGIGLAQHIAIYIEKKAEAASAAAAGVGEKTERI